MSAVRVCSLLTLLSVQTCAARQLHLAVIAPENGSHPYSLRRILPPIELAVRRLAEMGDDSPLPGWRIELHVRDTNCSSALGPIEAFKLFYLNKTADMFLGPVCEYVIAPVARYAAIWGVPVVTPTAQANAFLDKQNQFKTLTRIMGSAQQLGTVFRPIMHRFGWKVAGLLYEDYGSNAHKGLHKCNFMLQAVYQDMEIKPWHQSFLSSSTRKEFVSLLRELMHSARIIILCASPHHVREILMVADDLNMVASGEYVFFNIKLSTSETKPQRPWHVPEDPPAVNEKARRAYEALITVTARAPDDDRYEKFSEEVKAVALKEFNYTYPEATVNTFVASFYEAVMLYAYALNDTLEQGYEISNGSAVTNAMWNRTFPGIAGNVSIDGNGDRQADYSLLDMDPATGNFEVVANYYGDTQQLMMKEDKSIHWSGGRTSPPLDKPVCGFDGSLCPDTAFPKYAIVSIVLSAVMVIMLITSLFMYRHYKLEAELASMTWKIQWDDVLSTQLPRSTRGKFGSRVSMGRVSMLSNYSADSVAVTAMTKQVFVKTGFYKGAVVAIKMLSAKKIDINRDLLMELKRMKDLHHDHLVRFIGMSVEPPHQAIFTEYCPKGSLQDILENEQIKLDWMFRYSLMHDIVKGMAYLHSSEVRVHSKLKSSNCVVDSRFVLKITDFGLQQLEADDENQNLDSYVYWKRRLWTAPELLRTAHPMGDIRGTQKGDVYSFAIIVQEIIMRMGPFYVHSELSPKEIVENVRNGQKPPFRPAIDDDMADEEVLQMMRRCWSEDPVDRPDFHALKGIIRRLNKDNESGNILDNLLSRMEQYANNLEALVEERTADYLDEKRKCEELLYQLLPKSVASQLIAGKSVVAEHYDSVTIYFSDIVGFTAISAESTPMQVVDLLNDLYTCFDSIIESYDVYKVETIGDAYMVVSGLPMRNGIKHAGEIAGMSLAMLEAVQSFKIRHRPGQQLKLRIGLHTGPVVAGVVGLKMPRYCLFGDTVNTSSRMESNGLPLRIHVSSTTKEALDKLGTFQLDLRGEVEMKGKGKMVTYWLRHKETTTTTTDLIDIDGVDLRETKV